MTMIAFIRAAINAIAPPAPITNPTHGPDLPLTPDWLALRAQRVANRCPSATAAYLAKHQILNRGN